MQMKVVGFTCPFCNAPVNARIREDSNFLFCQSCGQKLYLEQNDGVKRFEITKNENKNGYMRVDVNKTEKTTDNARIKESDDKKEVQLAKIAAKQENDRNENRIALIIAIIVFLLAGFLTTFTVVSATHSARVRKKEMVERVVQADEIKIPQNAYSYEGEYYESVAATLKCLGFENVEIIAQKDISTKYDSDLNQIASISIAGNFDFEQYDIFKKTDKVVITYHALEE